MLSRMPVKTNNGPDMSSEFPDALLAYHVIQGDVVVLAGLHDVALALAELDPRVVLIGLVVPAIVGQVLPRGQVYQLDGG